MTVQIAEVNVVEKIVPKGDPALRNKLSRDGYAILDERLDDALLDRLVTEVQAQLGESPFDFIVDGTPFYGERMRRAVSLTGRCPSILEVLAQPFVARVMESSMLDHCRHVLLSASTALEVLNQGVAKPQPFHRDENIYAEYLPRVPNGPEYTINIAIAGTEFTKDNGATLLVPGSNRWDADRRPGPDDPVTYLEMPRGGIGIWLGSTFHGAGVNRTDTPRLGILFSFVLGYLRTIENQYLTFSPDEVRHMPETIQRLLGFDSHGMSLGLHDGVSPMRHWS